MQAANQTEVRRRLQADRVASAAASAAAIRGDRSTAAKSVYERLVNTVRDLILDAAPAATLKQHRNLGSARKLGWSLRLGDAELTVTDCATDEASWGGWQPPAFTVEAWGGIGLRIPRQRDGYDGRAHSLWFGDVQEQDRFAWYETAFMLSPLIGQRSTVDPFHLDPGEEAAKAVGAGLAKFQVAWPFTRLEPENLDDFVGRWAGWFAAAAAGTLSQPSTMPERSSDDTYRRT